MVSTYCVFVTTFVTALTQEIFLWAKRTIWAVKVDSGTRLDIGHDKNHIYGNRKFRYVNHYSSEQ
jgi:hypothetical protein